MGSPDVWKRVNHHLWCVGCVRARGCENPMRKPFGWSVAAHPASNGDDLDGFETIGDRSTRWSENHEDPRRVEACGSSRGC